MKSKQIRFQQSGQQQSHSGMTLGTLRPRDDQVEMPGQRAYRRRSAARESEPARLFGFYRARRQIKNGRKWWVRIARREQQLLQTITCSSVFFICRSYEMELNFYIKLKDKIRWLSTSILIGTVDLNNVLF